MLMTMTYSPSLSLSLSICLEHNKERKHKAYSDLPMDESNSKHAYEFETGKASSEDLRSFQCGEGKELN